jgi:hypothetical protein
MSEDEKRPVPINAVETARRTANKIFRPGPGRFQPGVSGNPSGQSHFYHQCRKIARAASPEMMYGLIELANNAEDERVRSVCLVAVLDRAGVRGEDYNPDRDPEIRPKLDVSRLSPEERGELRRLLELATLQQSPEAQDPHSPSNGNLGDVGP